MAKNFSRKVIRKIKKILKPDEIQNVIEKEFSDSRGNKLKFRFDFNPHSPNKPTIQGGFKYGDDKNNGNSD